MLEQICEKYGDFKWPPYPRELVFPDWIKEEGWAETRREKIYKFFHGYRMKFLRMRENEYIDKILVGDQFNTNILSKKRKTGLEASRSYHRAPQLFPEIERVGHIVYRNSFSGAETIKKEEIMKNRVHRVEVASIDKERKIVYCVALAHTFNKDNLIENLTNCFYQRYST